MNEIGVNYITLIFLFAFFIPIFIGLIKGLQSETFVSALVSICDGLELILSTFLSLALTAEFFVNERAFGYTVFKYFLPNSLIQLFRTSPLLPFAIISPMLIFILWQLSIKYVRPSYHDFFKKLYKNLDKRLDRLSSYKKMILGGAWGIPIGLFFCILVTFFLNIFIYLTPKSSYSFMASHSKAYTFFVRTAVNPTLDTGLTKNISILNENSFAREVGNKQKNPSLDLEQKYFNGITLKEAVYASDELENFSRELTRGKLRTKEKAALIYEWISENIVYDQKKGREIATQTLKYSSGAMEAFNTRKGICFDYASLFIAMCKANDIEVSLVTGLAYNGEIWGNHAWNQFYDVEEKKWLNIDTTFGTNGDYFATSDPLFSRDHKYAVTRKVWE